MQNESEKAKDLLRYMAVASFTLTMSYLLSTTGKISPAGWGIFLLTFLSFTAFIVLNALYAIRRYFLLNGTIIVPFTNGTSPSKGDVIQADTLVSRHVANGWVENGRYFAIDAIVNQCSLQLYSDFSGRLQEALYLAKPNVPSA